MKVNSSSFISLWMLSLTATWPHQVASRRRKYLARFGADVSSGCVEANGTDARFKTWASRIMVACPFSNFVGRTICVDPDEGDVYQEEMDRRVRAFFVRLTLHNLGVITAFLDARSHGIAVSGSSRPVKALTMDAYASGLAFLFGEAYTNGSNGGVKIVPECAKKDTPWQLRPSADRSKEEAKRKAPGSHLGSPMARSTVKRFKSAARKSTHLNGEQSLQSAAVTPEMVQKLYNWLFLRHMTVRPATALVPASTQSTPSVAPVPVCEPARTQAAASPPTSTRLVPPADTSSTAKTEFMGCFFHAMLWLTLVLPITLLSMTFGDISLPNLTVPRNLHVFRMYVECSRAGCMCVAALHCHQLARASVLSISSYHVLTFVSIRHDDPLPGCVSRSVTVWLFYTLSLYLTHVPGRHGHYRYINIMLRVTKRDRTTTDFKTLRLYSCYPSVTPKECAAIGQCNVMWCPSQHLSIPLLFQGTFLLAVNHPAVGMDTVMLFDQPLFFALSARSSSGFVCHPRPMTANEVNARFAADLAAIGEQRVNGERPRRLFGPRRGGAKNLLDQICSFERVMRNGDWQPNSDSFLV